MKILLCHNFYQQPGGEDQVFADERWLLESHGHQVVHYTRHNDEIRRMSSWQVARSAYWNQQSADELKQVIRQHKPDVMHCTNTFPLISPAAYYAAHAAGVAVVQSLHNYRLICPGALLMRDNKPCHDCVGKRFAWPAVLHGCYRGSRTGSGVVASMLARHQKKRTWTDMVDRYIALTEFSRAQFIEGGLPAEKISVKPNFVHPDPGPGTGSGHYAIFVGRLSAEKGVETLLDAWSKLSIALPLKVVGDGPLKQRVQQAQESDKRIDALGWKPLEEVCSLVGQAKLLVMPSIWYETFGRTTIEAFAKGTPVIASRLGAMEELVDDGRTGLHFTPGCADDLAMKIDDLIGNPCRLEAMRQSARQTFEDRYTAKANYNQLIEIYNCALRRCGNSYAAEPAVTVASTV